MDEKSIDIEREKVHADPIEKHDVTYKTRGTDELISSLGFGYDFIDKGVISGSFSRPLKEPVVDINNLYKIDKSYVNSNIPSFKQ